MNESVQSILDQSWNDWELVLVNDASTDDTGAMIDAWASRDARIRAVHLSENVRLPRALNRGFAETSGALLTWTSDDNRYRPRAFARLVNELQTHPDIDLVYADWTKIDDAGSAIEKVSVLSPQSLPLTNGVGLCFLFRRKVFDTLGGYDPDLFLAEDYDFLLRAFAQFVLKPVHEDLYEFRIHESTLTATRQPEIRAITIRALLRWVKSEPCPTPLQRMQALVHCSDLAWNNRRLFYAQWLLWRAMWEGRSPCFFPGGRMHAVDALCGIPVGKALRRAGRYARRFIS